MGLRFPSVFKAPGPTATISPSEGFSLAVSGIMIPPFDYSSFSNLLTKILSCNGLNFIYKKQLIF